MAGGAAGMYRPHVAAVTGDTGPRRKTSEQARDAGGVTEVTIVTMGDLNRRIGCRTRIVAIRTRAGQGNQVICHMVDAAVSGRFIRVAGQTVGRIGACVDGVDNLCSGTVMTGRAIA